MWGLVVLPISLIGAPILVRGTVSSVFALTGGSRFLAAALALDQWQRYKGFKRGEGTFTPKANNDEGIAIIPGHVSESETMFSRCETELGSLAKRYVEEFTAFANKRLLITRSEAQLLASMTEAVIATKEATAWVFELAEAASDLDSAMVEMIQQAAGQRRDSVEPILEFLHQFPKPRIQQISEKDNQ